MLPPPELVAFTASFAEFHARIGELIDGVLDTSGSSLSGPLLIAQGPAQPVRWHSWLDATARPRLRTMREAVERRRARLIESRSIAALAEELDQLIAAQSELVELDQGGTMISVSLRRYLDIALRPELEPAFAELDRTLEAALRDLDTRIVEAERTVDYYVLAVQRHAPEGEDIEAEELAQTGADRVECLIEELRQRAASWARRARVGFVEPSGRALADACAPYLAHRPAEVLARIDAHDQALASGSVAPGPARRALEQLHTRYQALQPIAGQLLTELRELLADERSQTVEPEPPILDPSELGATLPLGYRRLFTGKSLPSVDLYVRRPALERVYADAIGRWLAGLPQQILVHGDRGAGKRTLTNHVLARVASEAALDIHWLRLDPSLRDEPAVAQQVARAFGRDEQPTSFAELTPEREESSRRRVIVVENTERLLLPSAAGLARMSGFLAMVGRSAGSTLWLMLMATPAATMVLHRLGFGARIPTIVPVPGMGSDELRSLLSARHRLSGFELEFGDGNPPLLERITRMRAPSEQELFYSRLWQATEGNPRQALYTWLTAARPHPRRDGRIIVDPPSNKSCERLPALALTQRLVLALLAQYGSLTSAELVTALAAPPDEVDGDVGALWAKGLVVPSREHQRHWTLSPTLAHPLVIELRSTNMI